MPYCPLPLPANRKGFTLVELLIALALLALMSLLSWRGLESVLRSRDAAMQIQDRNLGITSAINQLAADLRNSNPQKISLPQAGSSHLMFIRFVSDANGAQREARVNWMLLNNQLIRNTQELENPASSFTQIALDHVENMSLRLFSGGRWLKPEEIAATRNTNVSEVQGIAIQLSLKEGDINRSFLVGGL